MCKMCKISQKTEMTFVTLTPRTSGRWLKKADRQTDISTHTSASPSIMFYLFDFQALVSELPEDRARSLLAEVAVRMPGMVFDILDIVNEEPLPVCHFMPSAPSWCKCGYCREMPTVAERVCCGCKPRHCLKNRPVSITEL